MSHSIASKRLAAKPLLAAAFTLSLALSACDSAPADPFAAALTAFAEGNTRTAMEYVDLAAKENPDDPDIRLLAGDIAMALGNADRAVSEYKAVVQGPSSSSLAKAKLVEAEVMANYLGAAEASVAQLEYDVPLAFAGAIAFALAKGDTETASSRLAEGLERFPQDPRLLTIEAERLFDNADPETAQRTLAPVLEVQPLVPQAHMLAGRMALRRRDAEAARKHFNAALSVRPNDQTAMLAMAAIARDEGDQTQAANWINKANDAGAPHPVGLLFAAQMAYDAGDIPRAYELIEIVPPAMASEPGFARLRGFIDAARGQYGSAILPLKSYLDNASDDYMARRVLAEAYAAKGEDANAWETIAPALDDPRAQADALQLALSLSEKTGRGDPAAIRAALAKRTGSADLTAQLRAAGDAIRVGDWAKADAIFAPLVDGLGKRDAALLNNAAAVKSQLGQHAQAIALARRALTQAPRSPQVLDTLGWALWREGKSVDEARSLLTQAAELAPNNAEIAEHWAIAHKDA